MSEQRVSQREVDEFWPRHFKIGREGLIEERRYCSGTIELGASPLFSEYRNLSSAGRRPRTIAEACAIVEELERPCA